MKRYRVERNAIFRMLTDKESRIRRVIAVNRDGKAMPPCGICRELMVQLIPDDYRNIRIIPDDKAGRVVTFGELTPDWWI